MDLKLYLTVWYKRFGTTSVAIRSTSFQNFMRWVSSQDMHIDGASEYIDSHGPDGAKLIWLNHKGMIWLTTTK